MRFKVLHKVLCKDASRSDLPQDLSKNLENHLEKSYCFQTNNVYICTP
jgi:hypothetical protein